MSLAYERPFRPLEITDSTVTSFSLLDMANQLLTEDIFKETGRNALTLVRGNDLTVTLMVLKAYAELRKHPAPGRITVTALSGRFEFSTAPQSETLTLHAGDAAICAAHLPHRIKALEASAFLLVIGGRTE